MTSSVQENISLASLTTLSIGGPARYFTEASTENTVLDALDFAQRKGLAVFVLGGGSNLLVSDLGFPGLVLRVAVRHVSFTEGSDTVVVTAGAGINWDSLVAECVSRNLSGIECLSGIPGWVGGTPVQNVGAYGQEVGGVIARVKAYDLKSHGIVELSRSDCRFDYRSSVFNTSERGRYIVLEVDYELAPGGEPRLNYPDLTRYFKATSEQPGLEEVRHAVRKIRAAKAMLLVDGDQDRRSAGSFFKNPVVTAEKSLLIEEAARSRGVLASGESLPRFTGRLGIKVPAAWLVERAGFAKGCGRGNVGLSSKHTLALVNRGGAKSSDVLAFAGEIQEAVEKAFGVCLLTELAFVGIPVEVQDRFGASGPRSFPPASSI